MKRIFAALAGLSLCLTMAGAARADEQEQAIGQKVYQELQQKGEILRESPDYAILNPIAQQIKRVADPQYDTPFTFILVHEKAPNAFAVPGGNVYVTDSLMHFVKNREELAGVLCHETSHTIHHDVLREYQKQQRTGTLLTIGELLLGGGRNSTVNGIANAVFTFSSLNFSREVETSADLKGAETCAEAGSNPWGMVWLFEQFEKADTGGRMEMLSDHPRDDHRISDLQQHFRAMPALFRRYNPDISSATPLGAQPKYGLSRYRR